MTEPEDYHTVFLPKDGLVHCPAAVKMGQQVTHPAEGCREAVQVRWGACKGKAQGTVHGQGMGHMGLGRKAEQGTLSHACQGVASPVVALPGAT